MPPVQKSRLDIRELIAEREQAYQPFRETFEGARSRAESEWQRVCVDSFRRRASQVEASRAISDLAMGPYIRQLSEEPNYLSTLERFRGEIPSVDLPGSSREDEALGHATRDFWNDLLVTAFGQFDETLDVFGPSVRGPGHDA